MDVDDTVLRVPGTISGRNRKKLAVVGLQPIPELVRRDSFLPVRDELLWETPVSSPDQEACLDGRSGPVRNKRSVADGRRLVEKMKIGAVPRLPLTVASGEEEIAPDLLVEGEGECRLCYLLGGKTLPLPAHVTVLHYPRDLLHQRFVDARCSIKSHHLGGRHVPPAPVEFSSRTNGRLASFA